MIMLYAPGAFTLVGTDKDGKQFDLGVTIRITFLIDPSGYAYEAVQSNRLEGVTATIWYRDETGREVIWDASSADQINPIVTLDDGAFAWVVPEGQWQVRLTKEGYQEARSEWMDVPPEQTNVYIPMVSEQAPEVAYCNVYADRAEITFSQYMEIGSVNENTVTFEGYTCAAEPIDKTETAEGSGQFYATSFSFMPDKPFAGEVKVAVYNASNYASREMDRPYTATVPVTAEPKNLRVPQTVTVKDGRTATVTVSAENAAGKTVSVSCDSANVTLSATALTLDKKGKATLTVTGAMPGQAALTFTMDGAALSARTEVTVALLEESDLTKGDVDGDREISAEDARLALRASVLLERYAPGSAPFLAADADRNGKLEAADARLILRASVELETLE